MRPDQKDFLWILIVSILILIWSSVPTWAGYRAETESLRFRGMYYDSQDYSVHIAMMGAGAHGDWAYQFRFTSERHDPAFVRLFYVFLGHLSGPLRLAPELLYEVARWIFGLAALLGLYKLMQFVFPDIYWARVGFLIAALGAGLGWFQLLIGWIPGKITPIDFWLTDDYVFFSLSVFPHFAFVTAAMCWALLLWLRFLERPDWSKIVYVALIILVTQLVNPIAFAPVDVGLLGAAVFSWWNARRIQIRDVIALLMLALVQLPLLIYNFAVLSRTQLWSQFTAQNLTLSPHPVYYIFGFALFWPFAILGLLTSYRSKAPAFGAVLFWTVCAFVLAFFPFAIQRRFLQNVTIPLGILATMGLRTLTGRIAARSVGKINWKPIVVILYVFLISLSSIQLSLGRATYLQTHPVEFYYSASLEPAFDWFRLHAHYNDFALAGEQTSQVLAQKTGLRVYSGHEMETLNYKTKKAEVQAFFEGHLPGLASAPIQWVIYGSEEKAMNPDFQPPENLAVAYESPELTIYRVK